MEEEGGHVSGGGGRGDRESKCEEMEAQDRCAADEKNEELVRGEVPRNLVDSLVEADSCIHELGGSRGEQGAFDLNGKDSSSLGISRYQQGAGNLLDGLTHLLENWKPQGVDNQGGGSGGDKGSSNTIKVNGEDNFFSYDIDAVLLEPRDEENDDETFASKKTNCRGHRQYKGNDETTQNQIALSEKDRSSDLPGLRSGPGKDQGNHWTQQCRDDSGVCGQLRPREKPGYPKWDGYLSCPEYLENPKYARKRDFPGSEDWDLHAPEIEVTKAKFKHEISRWLTINEFTKKIAEFINRDNTLKDQINKATCEMDEKFLNELIKKEIVLEWGTVEAPPEETLFIGNVFLHPEPLKERWRLIFHPYFFNRMVRLLRLQSVKLPRLREILKQIDEHTLTLKLDLKCAFFQIGIQPGLFCFRRAGKLYTLTRLPMGSSISVLVAEALSLLLSEEILKEIKNNNLSEDGQANAFVDDIFVSVNPFSNGDDVLAKVHMAVGLTTEKLGVTLKLIHRVGNEISLADNVDLSFLADGIDTKSLDEMEVLGVDYHYKNKTIKLKKEFQKKAIQNLKINDVNSPRDLWRVVGTCFYAIYALGICPARFPGVFELLGRVAVTLVGAGRFDPRWESKLKLTEEEMTDLKKMVDVVLTFPTGKFERNESPEVFVFTDASNLGLGVVIIHKGKVIIKAREWSPSESLLSINSKEVIAANWGVSIARKMFTNTPIMLAVDNTAAFFDIINGYSKEPEANKCVLEVRSGGNLGLIWVPTELMPADGPSRLKMDDTIPWKVMTILNHTVKYVFLHQLL